MGEKGSVLERAHQAEQSQGGPAAPDADDISAAEYVAQNDRQRRYGYCAVPHHARQPSHRARVEQARRRRRGPLENDGN